MKKHSAPFGRWPSSISAGMVASGGSGSSSLPRELHADATGVYWIEPRADEGGRSVIRHRNLEGEIQTLTPPGFSVRTRVHEYGGGSYLVAGNVIYFSNEADQRLYLHDPSGQPIPLTPIPMMDEKLRYADGSMSPDGEWMIYVCEKHMPDGRVVNCLSLVSPKGQHDPIVIHSDHDFYANPRISPDGKQVLWLTWDLPHMPWQGTDLWIADIEAGQLTGINHLAGGADEAIFQPEWGQDGEIYYASDRTGWWNLYRLHDGDEESLAPLEVDFGFPLWMLSYSTYTQIPGRRIAATYLEKGKPGLAIINLKDGSVKHQDIEYNYLAGSIDSTPDGQVWFLAGSTTAFPGLSRLDVETGEIGERIEVHKNDLPLAHLSGPEQINFKSTSGGTAYAYYYPPTHPEFEGLEGELPPLIVNGHGGPTSAAKPYLNLEIQFWTSRGFAIVDVDYSGSTGYGREYRNRLKGQWGVLDVADCVEAARHLAFTKRVDPARLLISGGSAGGYIVLQALTTYDLFAAGASYYGVADILSLLQTTHKFESGYDTYLIGPYPESADIYRDRSPIHHAHKIKCPVILFQGLDDPVVPPSQSEILVSALKKNGIYYQYITFEGEGHGFRRAENIQAALEAELAFYLEVLSIPPIL